MEIAYLDLQTDEDDAMATIVGASTEADRSDRLAFSPNAGLGVPEGTRSHSRRCPPVTLKTSGHWPARPGNKQSDGGPQASHYMPEYPARRSNGKSLNGCDWASPSLHYAPPDLRAATLNSR